MYELNFSFWLFCKMEACKITKNSNILAHSKAQEVRLPFLWFHTIFRCFLSSIKAIFKKKCLMAEKAWLEISIFEACVMRKYVTKSYYTILSDFGRTPFLYKSTLISNSFQLINVVWQARKFAKPVVAFLNKEGFWKTKIPRQMVCLEPITFCNLSWNF